MKVHTKYDAIIIGSGIGGLVCSCYLAKKGIKILAVEKHIQPGGYCTSFERRKYIFDAAVHSLRGINEQKQLGIIFKDLNLRKAIPLKRITPSDIIIYGNKKLYISNNLKDTIESFKHAFPTQRREIESFFSFLCITDFVKLYKLTYKNTFYEVLNSFFSEEEIKECFNILLGNLGLGAKYISALSAVVFLEELFTDGGYYPENGLRTFPNALVQKIHDYGSNILFANEVKRIVIKNNAVAGIILKDGSFIASTIIVSNIDAHRTYFTLIGKQFLNRNYINHISNLIVSPSAVTIYLGLAKKLKNLHKCCTLWYFPSKNSTNCYSESFYGNTDAIGKYVIFGLSSSSMNHNLANNKNAVSLTSIAPWKSPKFWQTKKEMFAKKIINMASKILAISNTDIEVKEIATPLTFYKYTHNYNGALYGWASLPEQINKGTMPQKSRIRGLYLCGHWATRGWGQGGISMVANSGRTTADMIFKSYFTTRKYI